MITIKKSTNDDAKYLAFNLRNADRLELKALGIKSPHNTLKEAVELAACFTGFIHQTPMAMFGVHTIEDGVGCIWLLGKDAITDKAPISFLRYSKKILPELIRPYRLVCNMVDVRNTVHVKWIEWLGFNFIREVTYGPENNNFYEFAKLRSSD